MGVFTSISEAFTGAGGAKAATGAAAVQKWATQKAINEGRRIEAGRKRRANAGIREIRRSTNAGINTLQQAGKRAETGFLPVIREGLQANKGLGDLVTDPNAQRAFIEDNPFYQSLIDKSRNDILANQAARGKVGSGGTADALQDSYLRTGADLLNQNIGQRLNVAGQGLNASQGRAGVIQNTGANIANLFANRGTNVANLEMQKFQGEGAAPLLLQGGNAQAAGIVGAANARAQGGQNLINTALGIGKLFAGGGFSLG